MKNLFNLSAPVQEIQAPAAPKKLFVIPKPSIKKDALKTIEKVLGQLQNVNNPKVDGLRKLFISLENGENLDSVVAYYKAPIDSAKKAKSKHLISGRSY